MKQVSYEFDWTHILPAVVSFYTLEDGFWRVEVIAENMTGTIPHTAEGQIQAPLPGVVTRMLGFRLASAPGPGFMTFKVDGGLVVYGSDTDQRGPQEGGGSPGGDPGPIAAGF